MLNKKPTFPSVRGGSGQVRMIEKHSNKKESSTRNKLRVWKLVFIALLLAYSILIAQDLLAPWFLTGDRSTCSLLVVDVYNCTDPEILNCPPRKCCIIKGMSVNDFRRLGSYNADVIIIITHAFNGSNKLIALGTSEKNLLMSVLKHPVSSICLSQGRVSGTNKSFIAVKPSILLFSRSFNNKTIILLTCYRSGISVFAEKMIRKGASIVAYPSPENKDLLKEKAEDLVKDLTTAYSRGGLKHTIAMLKSEGFIVLEKKR